MKHEYFKFYFEYIDLLNEVSIFKLRKLLKAICGYVRHGFLTEKLDKKTMQIYEQITSVMKAEQNYYKKLGNSGSKKRWSNGDKKRKNNTKIAEK